jgi:leader peptidase (prepilin peptidase)/N-methyltransferase
MILVFVGALIVLAVFDARKKLLPIEPIIALLLIGLFWNAFHSNAVDAFVGLMIGAGFFGGQWLLSRGRWIGDGDIWLAAAIGAWLGLHGILVALYMTYVLGGIIALTFLLMRIWKRGQRIPFAPFLALGAILAVLFFSGSISVAQAVQVKCLAPILKPIRGPQRPDVFLVTESCNLLPIKNPEIYLSHFHSWSEVVFLEDDIISRIPMAGTFLPWGPYRSYPDRSLVKITTDPNVYLKIGGTIYPFASEKAFLDSGFRFNQVEDVIGVVLKQWNRGHEIRTPSDLPYATQAPVPAPVPSPAPTPTPTPTPTPSGPYSLGALPSGFQIAWPAAPNTNRQVSVSTAEQFNAAASVAGSRISISRSFGGDLIVSTSDIDIVTSAGVQLGRLVVNRGVRRIRFVGGQFSQVEVQSPTVYWPTQSTDPNLFVEDVLFDGVRVVTPRTGSEQLIAFNIQGRRIAIIRSSTSAWAYSVWSGASATLPSEDIVLAGNDFVSDGGEATVRLVNVRRSATIENRLTNGTPSMDNSKHNYRVHGVSTDAFAARNVFIHSGTMNGTMDGDQITRMWFINNTLYQLRPDLFNMDLARITNLTAYGNTTYSNLHTCYACSGVAAGWDVRENTLLPYRTAP